MRMLTIGALLVSAACTTSPESHQDTLPSDAYYIICGTGPSSCSDGAFELGFCGDGTYSWMFDDEAGNGYYTLGVGVAVDKANDFEFDFRTQTLVLAPGGGIANPFSPSTAAEDALVACAD